MEEPKHQQSHDAAEDRANGVCRQNGAPRGGARLTQARYRNTKIHSTASQLDVAKMSRVTSIRRDDSSQLAPHAALHVEGGPR